MEKPIHVTLLQHHKYGIGRKSEIGKGITSGKEELEGRQRTRLRWKKEGGRHLEE